jgi:NitT/TauT family transport system substrate-binding protein
VPDRLRVVVLPFLSFAPYFIAIEEGLFERQGIELEIITLERGAEALPALIQGQIDVLGASVSVAMLRAMAQGAPLRVVADKGLIAFHDCVGSGYAVRRTLIDSGAVAAVADLAGRSVAMEPAEFTEYSVDLLLNTAGLSTADVRMVDVPFPAMSEAFAAGSLDLTPVGEPWLTRLAESGTAIIWRPTTDILPGFQFAVILFGPTLLEQNPDLGRRFMAAYLEAVRLHNQGKSARNLEILAEHTGLEPELLERMCWYTFNEDGSINLESVLDFQAWAVARGYLDRPAEPGQIWEPRFAEQAVQTLEDQAP